MSEGRRPARVRVTGPPRHPHAPRPRHGDIDEDTALGEVYLDSLLRAQLSGALRVLAVLALTVGSLPLLFWLAPDLADVHVLGLPLGWLLPGVLVHPWLLLLGLHAVRRAEAHERDFAALLEDRPDRPDRPGETPGPPGSPG